MNLAKILAQATKELAKVEAKISDLEKGQLANLRIQQKELQGIIRVINPDNKIVVPEQPKSSIPQWEQIYNKLPSNFTLDTITTETGDRQKSYQIVSVLKQKGYIETLGPGNYQKIK